MAATLLLATEADEGLGHIAPWAGFVTQALQQGLRVHRAAPNLGALQGLAGCPPGVGLWQAPVLRSQPRPGAPAPKSWPELLVSLGYGNTAQLTGALRAWVSILEHLKPDVVLADYAPALMAAARVAGVPCLEVGSGFCVPPLLPAACHFPGVRVGSRAAMDEAAAALTTAFNEALRSCGCAEALDSLAGMARWPARRVVVSPAELDHYGPRPDVLYAGFLDGNTGTPPAAPLELWPARDGRNAAPTVRVLGYLKPATPGLPGLVQQLREAGIEAHLVVPGNDGGEALDRQGSVTIASRLVDLPQALRQADVYLSNGGLHGIGLALEAGCWPVVAPMQAEQVAMARNLVSLKRGGLWLPESPVAASRPRQAVFVPEARPAPLLRGAASAEALLLRLISLSKQKPA